MNREILFRGKDENGNWHEGTAMRWNGHAQIIKHCHMVNSIWKTESVRVIPETVGQFTGLIDKNGAMIFEGDILLHDDYSNGACITFKQYESKSVVSIDNLMKGCGSLRGLPAQIIDSKCIKIIGNIHDNSNLLTDAN